MKTIAVIEADLDRTPIGTRSRLAEELVGESALRRTVRRALAAEVGPVFVVCPARQRSGIETLLSGLDVSVETHAAGPPPYQLIVQTSRKWSLDTWRGGISGTCVFDESLHCGVLSALGRRESADAVISIPAAAVLLDPTLAGRMAGHFVEHADAMKLEFVQAPPGLAATWYTTDFLAELTEARVPPGALMAYNPDKPQLEFEVKDCCFKVPPSVVGAWGRMLADTQRGLERCGAAIAEVGSALDGPDAAVDLCRWLRRREAAHVDDLPRELEIELTTDDQLSESTLRPRGRRLSRTGTIDPDLVARIAGEMAAYDDSAVVLGGFGEPLLHPQFDGIVAACRNAGIYALAVRTNGLALDEAAIEVLMRNEVDVVTITLDATDAETYRRLHGADGYDRAVENTRRLTKLRAERSHVQPLVVPEIVKTNVTYGQMEAFFDEWIRCAGSAMIAGCSDYGGLLADERVMNLAPPIRSACVQIRRRAMLLSDGRLLTCDQDPRGLHAVGDAASASLASIWRGAAMDCLRAAHAAGRFDGMPLCSACTEWHRP